MTKREIFVATNEDMVNAGTISEDRPLSFKPYQSARFLAIKEGALDEGRKHTITIMSKMQGFEQVVIPFRFSDRPLKRRGHILLGEGGHDVFDSDVEPTNFGNFNSPLVLSGRKAYVVCSSNGALSANWTWMGVSYDNGGLYVPPVRAFGRTIVEMSINDGVRRRLPNFVVSSRHENGTLETHHELAGISVRRRLSVPFDHRGFIMAFDMSLPPAPILVRKRDRKHARQSRRKIRIHFLIDGNITSYGLAAVSNGSVSAFNRKHSCLQVSSIPQKDADVRYFGTIGIAPADVKPSNIITDSFNNDLEITYDFEIADDEHLKLALVGTGGLTGKENCLREYLEMRNNYSELIDATGESFRRYDSSTLGVSSPQDHSALSKLISAFRMTKSCLQYLKTRYDGLGEGICAGLPRFPNYWARDTGWTLRGYLALGDYAFVASTIDNFLKHQAKSSKNGLRGELPMIISGKAFLHATTYGSADSTFLFPPAILRYVLGTGDVGFAEKRWKSIIDLVEWGFLKDSDGDGLVENDFTGVAQKMSIQDSTWMDHIDRRKSANDIQALFYDSLQAGVSLAKILGDSGKAREWTAAASRLKEKIDAMYWNQEDRFYYDTIRKDGSRDRSIRPNALVLLLADAVKDKEKAHAVLSRVERHDVTTPWGVRTLSASDPAYRPTLYHDGAVWPLVTGWAALCETKYGRNEQALFYVKSMADRILSENGMFAETYRGDRPEPFNSCILQAWSAGMYAWAFTEMMVGLKMDMVNKRIQIEPKIPSELAMAARSLKVNHTLRTLEGLSKLTYEIDPIAKEIKVSMKGKIKAEITSDSYSLRPAND